MSRRRVITLSVSAAMAMAVAILAALLDTAPARAEGAGQQCNSGILLVNVAAHNCDQKVENDHSGPSSNSSSSSSSSGSGSSGQTNNGGGGGAGGNSGDG